MLGFEMGLAGDACNLGKRRGGVFVSESSSEIEICFVGITEVELSESESTFVSDSVVSSSAGAG